MGVRMQTFLIKSRDIEALHYNADARLLLIKYSSGDIRSFTGVSPRAMRRLLGAGPEIGSGSGSSDLVYQAEIRKGGRPEGALPPQGNQSVAVRFFGPPADLVAVRFRRDASSLNGPQPGGIRRVENFGGLARN
nr:KTSC domain-containing protein [Rhizobium sp. NZLR1]